MGILKNFDIFNYLGVAVICIAADEFKIIKINEEAELITGYQEQELLNQNIFNIFSDHQKRIIDSILSLDTKKPCREKNLVLRRKTGRFVDVSISVMSHKDSNIKIITITDETMIKKAEWEIADLRSMMLQNAKLAAIGEVSAGIAHEVNNPLAIIIGLCDNLLERVSDENVREEILKITKTTERVSKIIRGLKEISRDDSTEPLVSVSLFDLISDSMWLVLDKIKSNNIQFNIKDFTNKAFVECNPSMLSQAIFNLIHNAIDAIKDLDEKWIYLKIQENKDNTQLIVEDSGNGISPEKTEKIFMPFYSTKLSSGGTGLGLSLAKKVIENCGGKIKYNSKAVNTTFEVYLNKSETQQNNYVCKEEVFTSFRPDDDLLFKDLKIVLVEDEEELAQLYKARFEKLGALVKTMGDFEQASYYIANKKNRIDLFITDICIINGTGEDLLKILNKLRPKVPSIVMTGSVSPNVELLYSLGVTNVLEKPFPFERIYYTVIQTILPLQMKWSRSQPRVKSQSSIQIFNKDESNYLKTANIGLGGMFVELENPNFKVNEDVEFELMLEVSAKKLIKFSGTAKVKWIRVKAEKNLKPGIGLEFVYIPENIRNELLNLIKSKQNSVYIPKTA